MKTGINFARCNVGTAEQHNSREQHYIEAVNASPHKRYDIYNDQTGQNSSWVNPKYSGISLPELLARLRTIYRDKVGQAPQEQDRIREVTDTKTGMKKTVTTAGWSPIREGVCPIKPTTKITDFGPFVEWLESKGLQVVRIDLHHDEGHTDELTGDRKYNHHAHIIVDWIDHDTGKSRKLSKIDTSEMQTHLAASLQMERGESKTVTGIDHLTPDEQRARAAANRVKELEAVASEVQHTTDNAIRECCTQLQHIGRNTVLNFDLLCKYGAVKPQEKEQDNRDSLDKETNRDLSHTHGRELLKEEALLRNLIYHTAKAVERIGKKLQDLAKAVPFWKRSRLAHEADLQARVATAEQMAANSTSEAEKVRKSAENAQIQAKSATAAANAREKKAADALQRLQSDIDQARKEGHDAVMAEWTRKYNEVYKPTADERDQLRAEVEQLKDNLVAEVNIHNAQTVAIAKELQRTWGTAPFEESGLKFTESTYWASAKKEIQQEQQRQQQRPKGITR